jgi:DNA-binding PadR family transcriptional regulator
MAMRDHMTELEGAILSEIHHRRRDTAFKVRRAFELSPSLEWQGGAGSVYPAIRRLTDRGYVTATPRQAGRKALLLKISEAGLAALKEWACDANRATSPGIDPFRLRSGIWLAMGRTERVAALLSVASRLREHLSDVDPAAFDGDAVEAARYDMSVQLQRDRLEWIERTLAEHGIAQSSSSS